MLSISKKLFSDKAGSAKVLWDMFYLLIQEKRLKKKNNIMKLIDYKNTPLHSGDWCAISHFGCTLHSVLCSYFVIFAQCIAMVFTPLPIYDVKSWVGYRNKIKHPTFLEATCWMKNSRFNFFLSKIQVRKWGSKFGGDWILLSRFDVRPLSFSSTAADWIFEFLSLFETSLFTFTFCVQFLDVEIYHW